jgi:rsbT antagonist protein RsbS
MLKTQSARPARHGDVIPVIELWGHLLVPLQGDIGDRQMQEMIDDVLGRISVRGAEGLLIDASGIWIVDSHLCSGLGRLATAASIMGVPSVLCGLSAEVVVTLQTMGFELTGVKTATTLEYALEALGVYVKRQAKKEKHNES